MDFVKKIGQICRQHYEKILLTLVLIGLASAVLYLYEASQSEAEKLQKFIVNVEKKSGKPAKPVDMSQYQTLIEQEQNPLVLNFSPPHNLFNPVKWKRMPNGQLFPFRMGTEEIDAIQVPRIGPLNFVIAFDRVAGSGYYFWITNEVAASAAQRRQNLFATLNSTNKVFALHEVKGPPEDPAEFGLELKEGGERVVVTKDKPYTRAEAYDADIKYPPENKNFSKQRVGGTLRFGGEDYKIIAINANEVVLFANSNEKKYVIRQSAAP